MFKDLLSLDFGHRKYSGFTQGESWCVNRTRLKPSSDRRRAWRLTLLAIVPNRAAAVMLVPQNRAGVPSSNTSLSFRAQESTLAGGLLGSIEEGQVDWATVGQLRMSVGQAV